MKRPSAWFASCPSSYRQATGPSWPGAPPWRTCEPGMVIDPSRDLGLGATARNTRPITSICDKPRRPRPPPPVILPSAPPARGHWAMTRQRQPHRHDPRLHQRGHQMRAERRPKADPPARPARPRLPGHFQHRPVPLLHRTQPHQRTRLPPAKRPARRKPGNQDGVSRTCPNYSHPATGTASANCRLGTEPRCPASTGLAHNRQVRGTGHSFHGPGSRSRLTKEMRL
jgi:hypothetical protein